MKYAASTLGVLMMMAAPALAELPMDLCHEGENDIFSCEAVNGKTISICASTNLRKDAGYLQYRYGTQDRLELEFPAEKDATQAKFFYGHYMRYQVDYFRVYFENHGHAYEVFSDYGGEEGETPLDQSGVRVDGAEILCAKGSAMKLGVLEGVLACEKDAFDCVE